MTQLIEQIQDATTPTDAAICLQGLADNCTQSEILMLIQCLGHTNPAIASMIVKTLEQLAPDSVEPLIASFHDSTDHGMQARIIQILANIGDDRALPLLIDMVGVEIANHCQGNVRRIAARGIGKMLRSHVSTPRHQSAINKLTWALLSPEDWALRYAAAVSLGEIATDEAIAALNQALLQERDKVVQQRIQFLLSA